MSSLFGKKDFRRDLQDLISKGNIKDACNYALNNASSYEELGSLSEAESILKTFIELCDQNKKDEVSCLEAVLERLVSVFIEENSFDNVIEYSIKLSNLKIKLGKATEAIQLLKLIDSRYKLSPVQMRKIVDAYISAEHFPNALKLIDRILEKEQDLDLIKRAGDISFNMGNFDKALDYFNILLVLDKNNGYALSKVEEIKKILAVLSEGEKKAEMPNKEVRKEKIVATVQETITFTGENLELDKNIQTPTEEKIITDKINENPSELELIKEIPFVETKEIPHVEELKETYQKEKPTEVAKIEKEEISKIEEAKEKQVGDLESQPKEILETEKKIKSEEIEKAPKETPAKKATLVLEENPEYKEALLYVENGNIEEAKKILETLALNLEESNVEFALEIYEKILLIDPSNVAIAKRIAKILLEKNRKEEAVLYLRSVANSSDKTASLDALFALADILKDNLEVKKEIFYRLVELGKFEDAIQILKVFPTDNLNKFLTDLLPFVKDAPSVMLQVSKFIKQKDINSDIKFNYFYNTYKLYFDDIDQIEGIKWMIQASLIKKLPLDDYVKAVDFLKEAKLPEESEIVAQSLYSYLEMLNDPKEAYALSSKIISLNVSKPIYFAKQLELAQKIGDKENILSMALKLAEHNAIQFAEEIKDAISGMLDSIELDHLKQFANYFDIAGMNEFSYQLYLSILKKDPSNVMAITKTLLYSLEKEDEAEILAFFDKFPPNAAYASIVDPIIEKYKELELRSPFDYNCHFVIGFLYYFSERYENSVASFQFVVRSKRHEAFMRLMLSICFENSLLTEFAIKQLEIALTLDALPEVRKEILYRYASLKKEMGDVLSARKAITELLSMGEYKDARLILETLPNEEKIIDIRSKEK